MKLLPDSVIILVIGVIILDIGVQAMQVTNVAMIYTLDQNSHSRITTIYMTSYFTGGRGSRNICRTTILEIWRLEFGFVANAMVVMPGIGFYAIK